jgi:VanZ family protein
VLVPAAALSVAYAVSDEYHQTFVDGRTGTWEDIVVDALGIASALLLIRMRLARQRGSAEPHPVET